MDTIPFHFLMFALDIGLLYGLIYWPFQKSTKRALGGLALFGGAGLLGILVFAILFRTNIGQCAAEGITYHGSVFLVVAAIFLFLRGRRVLSVLCAILGLFVFGLGFDMLVLEPYSLVVENYKIETPKLKKPLRIAFVADIQTDRIGAHERKTLQTIKDLKPPADLVLFGGDYLQYYEGTRGVDKLPEQFRKLLKDAKLEAPYGVFAVNGNVDPSHPEYFEPMFAETGVEALFFSEIIDNQGADKGLEPIDIVFLQDVDSINGVGERGITDSGNFQILLGHYPNYAIKDYMHAEKAPDLMLAGHTHGGQIYIPFWGPLRVKFHGRDSVTPASMYRGMFTFKNGGHFLVTRGSGMERGWAPRVRFLCRPEISVIDVIPKAK